MAATVEGWTSELARELAEDALERFLRYVRIDTQSDPLSTTYPSTEKQLDLLRLLADELKQIGRYEGGPLPLPANTAQVLDPDELPELNNHVGHDIVTSDGSTLLGADDK